MLIVVMLAASTLYDTLIEFTSFVFIITISQQMSAGCSKALYQLDVMN